MSSEGVAAAGAFSGEDENGDFSWDQILNRILIVGVCILVVLIGAVIGIIAVNLYRKRKAEPKVPQNGKHRFETGEKNSRKQKRE